MTQNFATIDRALGLIQRMHDLIGSLPYEHVLRNADRLLIVAEALEGDVVGIAKELPGWKDPDEEDDGP